MPWKWCGSGICRHRNVNVLILYNDIHIVKIKKHLIKIKSIIIYAVIKII